MENSKLVYLRRKHGRHHSIVIYVQEFRRKSLDTLTHEQRFMAAQQRRGLEVMDTTDEDREFEEERQRVKYYYTKL
jgi:hypothetical protein